MNNLVEMLFMVGAFLAALLLLLVAFAAFDYVKKASRNLVLQGKPQASRNRLRNQKTYRAQKRSKNL